MRTFEGLPGAGPPTPESQRLFGEFGWTPDRRVHVDRYVDLLKMAGYDVFDRVIDTLVSLDGIKVNGEPDLRLPGSFGSVVFGSTVAKHHDLFRWSTLQDSYAGAVAQWFGVTGIWPAAGARSDSRFLQSYLDRRSCLLAVGLSHFKGRTSTANVMYYLLEDGCVAAFSNDWFVMTFHSNPLDAVFDRLYRKDVEQLVNLDTDEIWRLRLACGLTGTL